jgi:serine/threonine protein phosphatase 1
MSKTFAIADLHGRFDLLLMALREIDNRAESGDTVVFTGDYIDRGPESANILTTLIEGPVKYHGKDRDITWVCLKGNHEEIMRLSATQDNDALTHHMGSWWVKNGGGKTLLSYGAPSNSTIIDAIKFIPQSHVDWISNLNHVHVDEHRIFVHAGLNHNVSLEDQDEETLIWKINHEGDERDYRGLHIVHGHDQFAEGPILLKGRTDLDTFAWATGRIVIGVFDDDIAGGPVDLIEVKGDPHASYFAPKQSDLVVGGSAYLRGRDG